MRSIPVSKHVTGYAVDLVRATRPDTPEAPAFVKEQVGHRYMSTTALYTGVSSDYKQRALAAALAAQLTAIARL